MAKYRKKPIVIEATQWFKNGDHPQDQSFHDDGESCDELEGLVVRYYRDPSIDGDVDCHKCGQPMRDHGWVETLEGGHIACPGDWIITGVQGEKYPIKDGIFKETYEAVSG